MMRWKNMAEGSSPVGINRKKYSQTSTQGGSIRCVSEECRRDQFIPLEANSVLGVYPKLGVALPVAGNNSQRGGQLQPSNCHITAATVNFSNANKGLRTTTLVQNSLLALIGNKRKIGCTKSKIWEPLRSVKI